MWLTLTHIYTQSSSEMGSIVVIFVYFHLFVVNRQDMLLFAPMYASSAL